MAALHPSEDGAWQPVDGETPRSDLYKLCANYSEHNVCNWAIPADDPATLCESCRLTQVIPDLKQPGNLEAWAKLETAKRRLVYGLLKLKLPIQTRQQDAASGLEFHFLSDSISENGDRRRVLTGHDNGLITINVAEADDVHREAQRQLHDEPYRTLIGHFRHEVGHFYWDRLIGGGNRLDECRKLFGDDRQNYQAALARHYEAGAPADWADHYISAYASTHPWEDWAESWAHIMHMIDASETAHSMGVLIDPPRADEPALLPPRNAGPPTVHDFDRLIDEWASLSYVLNNFARGLGLADTYPFVLSRAVIDKLRFVCETIACSDA